MSKWRSQWAGCSVRGDAGEKAKDVQDQTWGSRGVLSRGWHCLVLFVLWVFFVVNIIHQFVIHAENLFTGMDKHWNIPWRGRPAFHRAGLFFPSIPIGPLVVISSYESFSDAGESRVWFASKNLTPCMMHLNDFLIAQIIAKCHSFPNMYDML